VEPGKNFQVTTDQFHLIVDYKIMGHRVDKSCVIPLAERVLPRSFEVGVSTSFYCKIIKLFRRIGRRAIRNVYSKDNKALLGLFIPHLVMPKKGKLNQKEQEQESERAFKKTRNQHSAIESNINKLEHRGLDRCPDKGYAHFKRYVGLGICAYNLHRIGAELMRQARKERLKQTV
jgi:hypothetical protein